jgi:hypothetical protein
MMVTAPTMALTTLEVERPGGIGLLLISIYHPLSFIQLFQYGLDHAVRDYIQGYGIDPDAAFFEHIQPSCTSQTEIPRPAGYVGATVGHNRHDLSSIARKQDEGVELHASVGTGVLVIVVG